MFWTIVTLCCVVIGLIVDASSGVIHLSFIMSSG